MELSAAERALLQSLLLEHRTISTTELNRLCPHQSPAAYDAALRESLLVRGLLGKLAMEPAVTG